MPSCADRAFESGEPQVIVFIDEVCEAERDVYLRLFSRHRKQSIEALYWMNVRERGEDEGKLPPEVLAALRKYVDETP